MKKICAAMAVLLGVLLLAVVYFWFGAKLNVTQEVSSVEGGYHVALSLDNCSLFPYEAFEFLPVVPEDSVIVNADFADGDLKAKTHVETAFDVQTDAESCTVEIGYYILGRRRAVLLYLQ